MTADSAKSLLSRGVKRRLPGGLATEFNSSENSVWAEKLSNDSAAGKASKGNKTPNSLSRSNIERRVGIAGSWSSTLADPEQHRHIMTWPNSNTIPASIPRPSHWQRLEESDADVAVDVDCCGDSGSMSKLCSRPSGMATCFGTKSWHRFCSRRVWQPLPTLPEQVKSLSRPMDVSLIAKAQQVCKISP